jgi:arylsulfatase
MPTLLDLINAKTQAPKTIDGISIAPTLLGEAQPPRAFLYREFTGYGGQQAVWMGHWKGVRQNLLRKNNKTPLKIQLFNLKTDIAESKDVAAQHPEVVAQIRRQMEAQHTPSKIFPIPAID